ncbi:MAG: DUF1826 domain-containing protein [Alphaproteobacteria bacterium]
MNAVLPDLAAQGAFHPVRMAAHADGLDVVHEPGVDLAIWDRPLSGTVDLPPAWAEREALRAEATVPDARGLVLDRWGPGADSLARDVGRLAQAFGSVAGADRGQVRLEVLDHDACRRWHVDYKRLRLLCTYAGPGTLWCARGEDGGVQAVGRQRRLSVGIYKGLLYPGGPSGRLLHRSPRIAAAGRRRLALCIDAAV